MRILGDANLSRLTQRTFFGQSLLSWMLIVPLVMLVAWVITSQLLLYGGWQKSVWLRVEINTFDDSPPPQIQIQYNNNTKKTLPVVWDDQGGYTFVGINSLVDSQPVTIQWIDTNRGSLISLGLSLWDLRLSPDWEVLDGDKTALIVRGPGLIGLPGSYHSLTFTFVAGPDAGVVEVVGVGQRQTVDLSKQPAGLYQMHLSAPSTHRGWVLLPPQVIDQISLELNNSDSSYGLYAVTLFDEAQQNWLAGDFPVDQLSDQTCNLILQNENLLRKTPQRATCSLTMPDFEPINRVSIILRLLIWGGITGLGLVGLGILSSFALIVKKWDTSYEIVESQIGVWLNQFTKGWSVNKVIIAVVALTTVFHLLYVFFVPLIFTIDSVDYYDYGLNFLKTLNFDDISLYRTPGYPIFIAFTIWIFGDQVQGIVLLQHLALAMLGPITVWFLYPRTNPLFAALGGLLVGLSPIMSITASTVWSESLFIVIMYLAIIVFMHYQQRIFGIFMVGLLVGVAVMVRPNSLVLLGLILVWLFGQWWCRLAQPQLLSRVVRLSTVLMIGYLIVTLPWYLHFYSKTGRWGLVTAVEYGKWLGALVQNRSPADLTINRPYYVFWWYMVPENNRTDVSYALMSDIQTATGQWLIDEYQFLSEAWREGLRYDPYSYLVDFRKSILFALLGVRPNRATFFYNVGLSDAVDSQLDRQYPLGLPYAGYAADTKTRLGQMSYRWEPPESPLRSALLWASRISLNTRWVLAALALCSLIIYLLYAPFRNMILVWFYWMATIGASSVIGVPAERYIMTVEPMLYLMITILIFVLFSWRLKRRRTLALN